MPEVIVPSILISQAVGRVIGTVMHHNYQIAKSMGIDGCISPKFLHSGPGYGGSCFPEDTEASIILPLWI